MGHEDRIPSSIEIQIGDVGTGSPDVKAAKFLSLGVIRMQSERAANHHGRQLQTIELVGAGGSERNSNKIKVCPLLNCVPSDENYSFVEIIGKTNFFIVRALGTCLWVSSI